MATQLCEAPRAAAVMAGAPVLLHHLRWLAPYRSWALLRLPKPCRDPLVGEVAHGVLAAWHDHDVDTLLVVYDEDAVIQMSNDRIGWADRSIREQTECGSSSPTFYAAWR